MFPAADILLWKQLNVSFGIILIFEKSGLPLLLIFSDVLLILIALLFIHANYVAYRNRQLETLPELKMLEEMDMTFGNDFWLFFKVLICLWLFSAIGSYCSFFTLTYVGKKVHLTILSIILLTFYGKYEEHANKYCRMIHQQIS
ncbi:hypothetical protein CXB51_010918 [Gossypium anomalum]|uniref:Reticulon domain-containing protein n=1 Tax=Gossypium anomalum TaxID=47600 RepID=A0A8J5Z3H5_9ROSI|nr:hypothetical protein CXB51_010918 [Gossypium anomalum]